MGVALMKPEELIECGEICRIEKRLQLSFSTPLDVENVRFFCFTDDVFAVLMRRQKSAPVYLKEVVIELFGDYRE